MNSFYMFDGCCSCIGWWWLFYVLKLLIIDMCCVFGVYIVNCMLLVLLMCIGVVLR